MGARATEKGGNGGVESRRGAHAKRERQIPSSREGERRENHRRRGYLENASRYGMKSMVLEDFVSS